MLILRPRGKANKKYFLAQFGGKIKSYSWAGLLGQPSGLAGGRVGPAGRDIWDWVNQYGADLTKNALVHEKRSFWPFLTISGPSRPQKWIQLEILHRMVLTRGLETPN